MDKPVSGEDNVEVVKIEEYPCSPRVPRKAPLSSVNPLTSTSEKSLEDKWKEEGTASSYSSEDSTSQDEGAKKSRARKWPTRWYWQFMVLTVRTFRQSRHILLSKLNFIQTFLLAAVVSLVWFQMPHDENSISDRYGFVSLSCKSLRSVFTTTALVFSYLVLLQCRLLGIQSSHYCHNVL